MSFIFLLTFLFLRDIIRARSSPRARNTLRKFWAPAILILAIPAVLMVWLVHQLRLQREGKPLDLQKS
jgi:hypothetical protein